MDRVRKHSLPKRRIIDRLRRTGFTVVAVSCSEGYDLLVNGHLRIALRVAFPRMRHHRVTVRARHYDYRYRAWHFNFHHHGRLDRQYADVIVCLAMEPRNPARQLCFVIPWHAVSGKTFSLHAGQRSYDGKYARFLDAWSEIDAELARPHLANVA